MRNPLLDREFLKKLDQEKDKQIFARLIALTADEYPIEQIEGRVTQGSINIDGASAVRRTCSLTLVGHDMKITDMNWAIRNKFKVEVGVQNLIDPNYPDIIWFKQGVYAITSFSFSESTTGHTVQISGKDKMVYLNGEFGGKLTSSVRFDVEDQEYVNGVVQSVKLPIYNIIKSALVQYAKEPIENIIINDLDEKGYELWDNKAYQETVNGQKQGAFPLYYFHDAENLEKIEDISLYPSQVVYNTEINNNEEDPKSELQNINFDKLYLRNELFEINATLGNKFKLYETGTKSFKISKVEYGEVAGYHQSDLIYPSELVLNTGESITALLDKLKSVLGEYEYFYNLDGKFVFQKKKTYVQGLFSPINGETIDPLYFNSKYMYEFKESDLITTYSNAPNIADLKNDFAVWGSRESTSGQKIPIYVRYAIDHKPTEYHYLDHYKKIKLVYLRMEDVTPPYQGSMDKDKILASEAIAQWPENTILYKGEVPSSANKIVSYTPFYQSLKWSFVTLVLQHKKEQNLRYYYPIEMDTTIEGSSFSRNGLPIIFEIKTNSLGQDYYQEFTDFDKLYIHNNGEYIKLSEDSELIKKHILSDEYWVETKRPIKEKSGDKVIDTESYDWREIIYTMAEDYMQHNYSPSFRNMLKEKNPSYKDGKTGYEQYYTDILGFWRQVYNPHPTADEIEKYRFMTEDEKDKVNLPQSLRHFSKNVFETPNTLNFWLDFLDTYGDLEKYSVSQIGDRIMTLSDDTITTISNKVEPQVEFVVGDEKPIEVFNLSVIRIPENMKHIFNISSQGISAQERAEALLYQYAICAEALTLNTIPIYYLEPNNLIYVENKENNIQGEYIVSKITIPLTYNGTMSITASKVIKNLK